MWFSFFTTLVFIAFMIPISINMIAIIKLNYKNIQGDVKVRKKTLRSRIKKVVVLFSLLVVVMFLSFFLNYLFTHR